jgi:hypothetical protein
MGVSNDPRELLLKNMIQKADDLFFLELSHSRFLSVIELRVALLTSAGVFCSHIGLRL